MFEETPKCRDCGSECHLTIDHREYYDDSPEQRMWWLRGWSSVRTGEKFEERTKASNLPYFALGVLAARRPQQAA